MKEQIDEIRIPIEDIKERHRFLYQEFKSKGIVATITLYSKKAHAQVYEYSQELGYKLVYGSSALFRRWREAKKLAS